MEQQSLFSDIRQDYIYPVPGKWGNSGWTIFKYRALEKELLEDAIMLSYNNVAPKSLRLDIEGGQ